MENPNEEKSGVQHTETGDDQALIDTDILNTEAKKSKINEITE